VKVRVSKTADVSIDEAANAGDIPDMPVTGASMSTAPAPEKSLMGILSGLWGWMLGGGLGVMLSIIGVGWWVKRQTTGDTHEDTCSR